MTLISESVEIETETRNTEVKLRIECTQKERRKFVLRLLDKVLGTNFDLSKFQNCKSKKKLKTTQNCNCESKSTYNMLAKNRDLLMTVIRQSESRIEVDQG